MSDPLPVATIILSARPVAPPHPEPTVEELSIVFDPLPPFSADLIINQVHERRRVAHLDAFDRHRDAEQAHRAGLGAVVHFLLGCGCRVVVEDRRAATSSP